MAAYNPPTPYPDNNDEARVGILKIALLLCQMLGIAPAGDKAGQGESGSPSVARFIAKSGQVTVGTTATAILTGSSTARYVSLFNNGTQTVYFDEGDLTPVADSGGTSGPRLGNGVGKEFVPGALWESPNPITNSVNALTQSGTSGVTYSTRPA